MDDDFTPTTSVVVAALNETDAIDGKLENILALDYPEDKLEIIVVTDGSTDDTPLRAGRFDRTTVLHAADRRGKTAALSRAALASTGDILVFSDANNLLSRDAIRKLVRQFADPDIGCVTGRKRIEDTSGRSLDQAEGVYWRYESAIREWEASFGSVSGVNGELLAVRRSAFEPPVESTVNDDFVLAMQAAIAGWRIGYARDAVSTERASATADGEIERRSRITAGRWKALWRLSLPLARSNPLLAWQVASHKALRLVLPGATVGVAVGCVASARHRRWSSVLLGAQIVMYALALLGRLDARRGRKRMLTYAPYYFVRLNAATTSGLGRALTKRSTTLTRWHRVERG